MCVRACSGYMCVYFWVVYLYCDLSVLSVYVCVCACARVILCVHRMFLGLRCLNERVYVYGDMFKREHA